MSKRLEKESNETWPELAFTVSSFSLEIEKEENKERTLSSRNSFPGARFFFFSLFFSLFFFLGQRGSVREHDISITLSHEKTKQSNTLYHQL